jgi:hypothetical protein
MADVESALPWLQCKSGLCYTASKPRFEAIYNVG